MHKLNTITLKAMNLDHVLLVMFDICYLTLGIPIISLLLYGNRFDVLMPLLLACLFFFGNAIPGLVIYFTYLARDVHKKVWIKNMDSVIEYKVKDGRYGSYPFSEVTEINFYLSPFHYNSRFGLRFSFHSYSYAVITFSDNFSLVVTNLITDNLEEVFSEVDATKTRHEVFYPIISSKTLTHSVV